MMMITLKNNMYVMHAYCAYERMVLLQTKSGY